MIGYKAYAKLKKKKAGLKTMTFSFSPRKVRKFPLEIIPTIPKPFGFHSRCKKPRTLPWKKTFAPTECLRRIVSSPYMPCGN